jgi:hypothetical protein
LLFYDKIEQFLERSKQYNMTTENERVRRTGRGEPREQKEARIAAMHADMLTSLQPGSVIRLDQLATRYGLDSRTVRRHLFDAVEEKVAALRAAEPELSSVDAVQKLREPFREWVRSNPDNPNAVRIARQNPMWSVLNTAYDRADKEGKGIKVTPPQVELTEGEEELLSEYKEAEANRIRAAERASNARKTLGHKLHERGISDLQIARALGISNNTVQRDRESRKLDKVAQPSETTPAAPEGEEPEPQLGHQRTVVDREGLRRGQQYRPAKTYRAK